MIIARMNFLKKKLIKMVNKHNKHYLLVIILAIIVVISIGIVLWSLTIIQIDSAKIIKNNIPQKAAAIVNLSKLPVSFVANEGQFDPKVQFTAVGSDSIIFFTPEGTTTISSPYTVFRLSYVGASSAPEVNGDRELSGKAHYFIGNNSQNWRTNISIFEGITYHDLYPGIDVQYNSKKGTLTRTFKIASGADVTQIRFHYDGIKKVVLDPSGSLVINIETWDYQKRELTLTDSSPYCYQTIEGIKKDISARYLILNEREVVFSVTDYDPRYPLVIESEPAYFGTSVGSIGFPDHPLSFDSEGNAYLTGSTFSSYFPAKLDSDQIDAMRSNAFVTKLDPTGTKCLYTTYVGGRGSDNAGDIAVDDEGNVYVTGFSDSNDFPITSGIFQPKLAGRETAFVTKLNPTGSSLVYSTYLGGEKSSTGYGIAVDLAGNAYVTGKTSSQTFPTTPGAYRISCSKKQYCDNVFITKLNPTGTSLIYSTYLGPTDGLGAGYGIAVDNEGNAYVAGQTGSYRFPTTPGAYDREFVDFYTAFVTKLDPSGSSLIYSTYLGKKYTQGNDIAVDGSGNAYVTGITLGSDFPTTSGAYQAVCSVKKQGYNSFVTKLNPAGDGLVYSTYLCGSEQVSIYSSGIGVDGNGNMYITGIISSSESYVDKKQISGQIKPREEYFLSVLNPDGSSLLHSFPAISET